MSSLGSSLRGTCLHAVVTESRLLSSWSVRDCRLVARMCFEVSYIVRSVGAASMNYWNRIGCTSLRGYTDTSWMSFSPACNARVRTAAL